MRLLKKYALNKHVRLLTGIVDSEDWSSIYTYAVCLLGTEALTESRWFVFNLLILQM